MTIRNRLSKHISPTLCALTYAAIALFIVEHPAAAQDLQTVKPDVLTVGVDLTYPPYNFFDDNNKASGSDPDFMRMLADEMGLDIKFKDTRFSELISGLNANHFDVVTSLLYITPERAKVIDFVPYQETGDSLLVRADSDLVLKQPEDLCGLRVSSIKGASWIPKLGKVSQDYCEKHNKKAIDVRDFPTAPQATQALLAKNVDAQFSDALVAKVAVDKLDDRIKITSTSLLYPVPIGIGVKKGNNALIKAISDAIDHLRESGQYQDWLNANNLEEPNMDQVKKILE